MLRHYFTLNIFKTAEDRNIVPMECEWKIVPQAFEWYHFQ